MCWGEWGYAFENLVRERICARLVEDSLLEGRDELRSNKNDVSTVCQSIK